MPLCVIAESYRLLSRLPAPYHLRSLGSGGAGAASLAARLPEPSGMLGCVCGAGIFVLIFGILGVRDLGWLAISSFSPGAILAEIGC